MIKIKNLLVLMLVLAIGTVTACKDDSGETEQEIKTRQLTQEAGWKVATVTLDPSSDFSLGGETVTLNFNSNGTFTATNTDALPDMREPFEALPTSGSWTFVEGDLTKIRLTGNTATGAPASPVLNITQLDDTNFTFKYEGATPKFDDFATVTVATTKQ